MPVTNIKFFNRNGSGPQTATSVERTDVVSIIYNSGSSEIPTLLGEFFISNSSDSGYDISASLRLGERSTLSFVTASLLSASATNITESATNFIFARRYPGTQLTPVTDYTIKAVNLDIKSNGLKMVSQSNAWIAATLLNTNTNGVISNITTLVNNGSVYWDGTKWVYFNFSNTTVPYVLKAGELNQVLPASKGGTSFTDLFSTSRNNILVGGGTQMSLTGSLSPSDSGSMIISNGTTWNSVKTSSLQFIAETSSYLEKKDILLTNISFTSSSVDQQIFIKSTNDNVDLNFTSKQNINFFSSGTINISANGAGSDLKFYGNTKFPNQIKNIYIAPSPIIQLTVPLNIPIVVVQGNNVTCSLGAGLAEGHIITLIGLANSNRFIKCLSGVNFASEELNTAGGYRFDGRVSTQLRYSGNKWFRHF